jgi:hypothetical protein
LSGCQKGGGRSLTHASLLHRAPQVAAEMGGEPAVAAMRMIGPAL